MESKTVKDEWVLLPLCYAIVLGANVTTSSLYDGGSGNWQLDSIGINQSYPRQAWSAKTNNTNQWIQVSFGIKRLWSGFTIKGRGDYDEWVKFVIV